MFTLRSCSFVFFMGLLLWSVGCNTRRPSTTAKSSATKEEVTTNTLNLVPLQKGVDLARCKEAIQALESVRNQDATATPVVPDEQKKSLQAFVPMESDEWAEVWRAELSSSALDSHHLFECLVLREIIASLEINPLPPLKKAEVLFDWVCRNAYQQRTSFPMVPAWQMLQRGYGNYLERAYLFQGLLRQIGLDSGLIGHMAMEQTQAYRNDGNSVVLAAFWAIGVRIDSEVYLFHSSTGKPLPALDGKGIATLQQVKTKPELIKSWLNTKPALLEFIKEEDIEKSVLFLNVPLSAMAPRMQYLDKNLVSLGVQLYADPIAVRDRFEKEAFKGDAFKDFKCRYWNPKGDPFTYTRLLSRFFPAELGGLDRSEFSQKMQTEYNSSLIPWELFPKLPLQELGRAKEVLRSVFATKLLPLVQFGPESPREKILRGQFETAIPFLTTLKNLVDAERGRPISEKSLEKDVAKWCDEVEQLYADISRAERAKDAVALSRAQAELRNLFSDKKRSAPIENYLGKDMSKLISAECTFLMAVCTEEQAARQQLRWEYAPDSVRRDELLNMWKNCRYWWEQYEINFSEYQSYYQPRFVHAKLQMERCDQAIRVLEEKK